MIGVSGERFQLISSVKLVLGVKGLWYPLKLTLAFNGKSTRPCLDILATSIGVADKFLPKIFNCPFILVILLSSFSLMLDVTFHVLLLVSGMDKESLSLSFVSDSKLPPLYIFFTEIVPKSILSGTFNLI